MASFEFLAIILTGLGLTASILYYSMILRNTNKTRKAALFSSIQSQVDTPEFWKRYQYVVTDMKGKTYDEIIKDFEETPEHRNMWTAVISFFQHLGWQLHAEHIDLETVGAIVPSAISVYEISWPILKEFERRSGRVQHWTQFQYLYDELVKAREKGQSTWG